MKRLASQSDYSQFVSQYDAFLLDMDGVLWQGSTVLPNVQKALHKLNSIGKKLIFVTNNSSKSRDAYVDKFNKLGFPNVAKENIFGSAFAAACYLTQIKFNKSKSVYLIGQDGLQDELHAAGFSTTGGLNDKDLKFIGIDELEQIKPDPTVGAVLTGFDGHLNYLKLAKAHTYLTHDPDTLFLSTNADSTYPLANRTFPGSGSLFVPLVTSTGRYPTVLGKPHSTMMQLILDYHHLDPKRTCMVGDRLDTDVLFGINGGTDTLLVLTGVTKQNHLEDPSNQVHPNFVISSFGDLHDI